MLKRSVSAITPTFAFRRGTIEVTERQFVDSFAGTFADKRYAVDMVRPVGIEPTFLWEHRLNAANLPLKAYSNK
jgi:hypothetical protein